MKCGTVLKINILTDAISGHPKGYIYFQTILPVASISCPVVNCWLLVAYPCRAAFVTFTDKESVEKAVSLSGSSFFSRVLTV
jgi:hypothetical protein